MAAPYRRLCCIHRLISLKSSCNSTKLNVGIRIHKCQGTRAFSASQFFLKKKSDSAKVTNVISDDQRAGLDKKLVDAAKSVATSLPGDKKLTESDLLQKLRVAAKLSQNQKSGDVPKSKENTGILLRSMRVVMSNKDAEGDWKTPEKVPRPEFSNFVLERKSSHLDQPTRKRHGESKLFGRERLGIFSEDLKATSKQPDIGDRVSVSLFDKVEKENAELLYNIPSNYFEEQMQLTKEGKIWTFPIDNEAGWEEEKNVKFYEHVFLEKHIVDFPQKGPIRHFMELVLVGLSKNPYMTAEQKKEHIHWFRDYFKQKQSTIEEGMGIPLDFKQASLG